MSLNELDIHANKMDKANKHFRVKLGNTCKLDVCYLSSFIAWGSFVSGSSLDNAEASLVLNGVKLEGVGVLDDDEGPAGDVERDPEASLVVNGAKLEGVLDDDEGLAGDGEVGFKPADVLLVVDGWKLVAVRVVDLSGSILANDGEAVVKGCKKGLT